MSTQPAMIGIYFMTCVYVFLSRAVLSCIMTQWAQTCVCVSVTHVACYHIHESRLVSHVECHFTIPITVHVNTFVLDCQIRRMSLFVSLNLAQTPTSKYNACHSRLNTGEAYSIHFGSVCVMLCVSKHQRCSMCTCVCTTMG